MLARLFGWLLLLALAPAAYGQITAPRVTSADGPQVATLEEQLINRLRATTEERQSYIRLILAKTEQGLFDQGRILAIERYAIKKNPRFPFPYFELHHAFEVGKRKPRVLFDRVALDRQDPALVEQPLFGFGQDQPDVALPLLGGRPQAVD